MHQLDIIYKETFNCKTLRIEDNSIYDCNLDIQNIILEVKPPGKDCFIPFPTLTKDWHYKVFNCNNLQLCCADDVQSLTTLPDGIYEFKYSYAPNKKTVELFYNLRTCGLMKRYTNALGEYLSNKCNYTTKQKEEIEAKLLKIKDLTDWAVWKVEECFEKEEGLELYNEANNLLNTFENGNSSCFKCS
jgi:hypothetical protein